ncbi:hypothetical protein [Natronospora cellulosivora (SeqCode)]
MKDQLAEFYSYYVNSDTVILLMDTAQGFINHQAKAFFDRTIPHYHPYIEMINCECHHLARYESYPDMVFYFDNNGLRNQEERVIEDYLYRVAYHYKSKAYRIRKDNSLKIFPLKSREAKNQSVAFSSTDPIEKLVIYNGSPRRSASNSALILKKADEVLGNSVEIRDLKERDKWQGWIEGSSGDKDVMFFMPLYVHAMPSHVMEFMERLQSSNASIRGSISFFVQSGFPESSQSHYLEAYFEQLSIRLERTYIGTAIKGGVESMQIRSEKFQDKIIEPMVETIVTLLSEGKYDSGDISKLARPIKFGKGIEILFKLIGKRFITHTGINTLKQMMLMKNVLIVHTYL